MTTIAQRDFTGKKVLVTGGSRGIGRACVRQLVEAGADVVFTYANNREAADSLVRESASLPGSAEAVRVDFRLPEEVGSQVEQLLRRHAFDALVNNAGLLRDAPAYRMDLEEWDEVMQVNLHALFAVTRRLIRPLSLVNGTIVNIASVAGIAGTPGQVNYVASKAGVIGLTRALAREVGPLGVRVNAVAPGYVDTDMMASIPEQRRRSLKNGISLRRIGQPDEIACAVLFLLSDEASYITGQVLVADGGLL
ncbi:3-oxoacyl-ACP reductase FabG [Brevibacillus humidisoli]|uniref:3-oxoacyl-ACP reductase family protein n=1 Tax=Brevibacillus humidisoli TaxID=2895522 RepID=UPI001E578CEE|nr:3-oxoacyl-ACP reductase family protein [Brevibacillus humidisoli]UFJ42432.1 3-oxoacyl-ACP reductase FabG [Brevibacillus humidisoli]